MTTPKITTKRIWSHSSVYTTCVCHNLYTRGDNEEYDAMLNSIDKLEPTPENIYQVAKDIYDHSKDQTITNIMFILEHDAVYTFYYVDGSDEI